MKDLHYCVMVRELKMRTCGALQVCVADLWKGFFKGVYKERSSVKALDCWPAHKSNQFMQEKWSLLLFLYRKNKHPARLPLQIRMQISCEEKPHGGACSGK